MKIIHQKGALKLDNVNPDGYLVIYKQNNIRAIRTY